MAHTAGRMNMTGSMVRVMVEDRVGVRARVSSGKLNWPCASVFFENNIIIFMNQ